MASDLANALENPSPPPFLGSPQALKEYLKPKLDYLFTARPTAVNLGAATRRLANTLQSGIDAGKDAKTIAQSLVAEGQAIDDEDVSRNKAMGKWGGDWLIEQVKQKGGSGKDLNVMTVCNTGSLATSVCHSVHFVHIIIHKLKHLHRDMELL